jgi:hypothetical protein
MDSIISRKQRTKGGTYTQECRNKLNYWQSIPRETHRLCSRVRVVFIYINDLETSVEAARPTTFADDTSKFITGNTTKKK